MESTPEIPIDAHTNITSLKLKIAKAKEREARSASIDLKDHISGPIPANRQVPVNVARRNDRVVSPDPPPDSRPAAKTRQKPNNSRGRRKGTLWPGGDGDGDSDSDPEKTGRSDTKDAQVVTKKRGVAKSEDVDHSNVIDDSFARSLVIEENERVKQLRDLREIGEKWEEMKEERGDHERKGHQMREMVRALEQSGPGGPVRQRLLDFDGRLREYLNDILYGVIKDNGWESAAQILTEEEEIVQWLEMSVLGRCVEFDGWQFSNKPLDERISLALKSVEEQCWRSKYFALALEIRQEYLESVPQPPSSDPAHEPAEPWTKDMEFAIKEYLLWKCSKSQFYRKPRFIDELAESFWAKIVKQMVNSATTATSLSTPDGEWLQRFEQSRESGHLKAAYIHWVIGDADPIKIEQLCKEWHRVKREDALDRYHRSMGSIKLKVEQVFCPGIVRDGEVSLLLLKGGFPTGIRPVSPNELKNLGWFRDEERRGFNFWRCERIFEDGTGNWLKVCMSGKVLGAFCLENLGSALQYTDDGKGGCVLNRRPLSSAERLAIFGNSRA
ncbi:hypothetical protein PFICI_07155 [Pestalotiopsis fici W106-1]|uniref:Uncharacterized protein n=1 Tax=Pestalotiopsis fici (strain W106-1 / CGMCC3.15140) TaxID=1229662 RepID=W3X7Q5_PESFW|nr:uncharacterized protein PFICI_07155 [Pestalotiopsis fici W106-1]ETS82153.1 hypothetical protein PFICI_07155 [Pestalotiopsis fici W106-1]